jgi:multimeric flavodoxin WrbA
LLAAFLQAAEAMGARSILVDVTRKNIEPCKEYIVCEKKGFCPIHDDMELEIYPLLRQAEVVVLSTPIFFYNMTAQMKAVVDRCQTFWARKYRLKLKDPAHSLRRGFLLSAAATRGKTLFEGLELTTRYFFDAIDARYEGSLNYRGIEGPKDMSRHPGVQADVEAAVEELLKPFQHRKKLLFAGRRDACRSQMAAAFAQWSGGEKVDVITGGSHPAEALDADMIRCMQEQGIDMAFRKPQPIEAAFSAERPDIIIDLAGTLKGFENRGAAVLKWKLPESEGKPLEAMRNLRDDIQRRVRELLEDI